MTKLYSHILLRGMTGLVSYIKSSRNWFNFTAVTIGISVQGMANCFYGRRNSLHLINIVKTELDDIVAVSCFSGDSAVLRETILHPQ